MSEEIKDETPEVEVKPEVVVETPKPVEAEKPKVEEKVISLPETETEGPGLAPIKGGAMGSTTVKAKPKAEKVEKIEEKPEEKVALFSTRSIYWDEVGRLSKGYNITTKAKADQWIAKGYARLATPEEIAKELGN